jgi:hypothetical protein
MKRDQARAPKDSSVQYIHLLAEDLAFLALAPEYCDISLFQKLAC